MEGWQAGRPSSYFSRAGSNDWSSSTTASTDDIFLWIFSQITSDIHCYRDVKSIPWNITKSVSRAGFSNLPTPPLTDLARVPGYSCPLSHWTFYVCVCMLLQLCVLCCCFWGWGSPERLMEEATEAIRKIKNRKRESRTPREEGNRTKVKKQEAEREGPSKAQTLQHKLPTLWNRGHQGKAKKKRVMKKEEKRKIYS